MAKHKSNKKTVRSSALREITVGAIGGTIAGIVVLAVSGSLSLYANLASIPDDVRGIKGSLEVMESEMGGLKTAVAVLQEKAENMDNRINSLDSRVEQLERAMFGFSKNTDIPDNADDIVPGPEIAALVIPKGYFKVSGDAKDALVSDEPSWDSSDIVASDEAGELAARDLQNENIIFSFEEDGKTVFFYGKFNENNRWDGRCVTNVYQDGILLLATDAVYDDGTMLRYEQIFSANSFYYYSNRSGDEDGDTCKYTKTNDIRQMASEKKPSPKDLFIPGTFKRDADESLLHIYHGGIADGYYNDNTGNAYMVCYYEDGKTRLVCQGQFKDGNIYDDTGKAWSIAMDREHDAKYALYRGIMHDSEAVRSQGDTYRQITIQEADNYISGMPFEDLINWDETMFVESK